MAWVVEWNTISDLRESSSHAATELLRNVPPDGFGPATRRSVDSVLHLDGWGRAWNGGADD